MRTPFTGVGTALVTPFTKQRRPRRSGGPAAGPPADRRRHSLPRAVRHDRREPDADARRARCASSRFSSTKPRGQVPVLAGAGGYDTQGGHPARAARCEGRRQRSAVGDAVLQQADAGRPVSALPGDRRKHAAADRRLQRARAAPACNIEPATLVRLAAIPNIVGVKEASGNMHADVRGLPRRAADFIVLSGDDAMTLPLMAIGGRGVISVASNEIPAEMVADGRSGRARRLRGGARDSRRGSCR